MPPCPRRCRQRRRGSRSRTSGPCSTAAATRRSARSATPSTCGDDLRATATSRSRAAVRHRPPGKRRWSARRRSSRSATTACTARSTSTALGRWAVQVEAWIDRFASWRNELEPQGRRRARPTSRASWRRARSLARRAAARPSRTALDPDLDAAIRTRHEARALARPLELDRRPRARPLRRVVRALPALVRRLRRRRARCCRGSPSWASTSSTCRRSTRSAHPPQGPQQRADAPARRPGQPVGDRRRRGRPHRRRTPSSGRSPTSTGWSRAARELGIEIALDFAIQCSPDHPWLDGAPGVVPPPARRDAEVRREPAQALPGHLQRQLRDARTGAGSGRRCATSSCSGSTTASGSSASTTRTRSRSASGSG